MNSVSSSKLSPADQRKENIGIVRGKLVYAQPEELQKTVQKIENFALDKLNGFWKFWFTCSRYGTKLYTQFASALRYIRVKLEPESNASKIYRLAVLKLSDGNLQDLCKQLTTNDSTNHSNVSDDSSEPRSRNNSDAGSSPNVRSVSTASMTHSESNSNAIDINSLSPSSKPISPIYSDTSGSTSRSRSSSTDSRSEGQIRAEEREVLDRLTLLQRGHERIHSKIQKLNNLWIYGKDDPNRAANTSFSELQTHRRDELKILRLSKQEIQEETILLKSRHTEILNIIQEKNKEKILNSEKHIPESSSLDYRPAKTGIPHLKADRAKEPKLGFVPERNKGKQMKRVAPAKVVQPSGTTITEHSTRS